MTTAELFKSLSPEQADAMLAFRDELLAANSAQNVELAAAKDGDAAKIQAQLDAASTDLAAANQNIIEALALSDADKKAAQEAHEAEIAALTEQVSAAQKQIAAAMALTDEEKKKDSHQRAIDAATAKRDAAQAELDAVTKQETAESAIAEAIH